MESSPYLRLVPGQGGPGARAAIRVLLGVVVLALIVFPMMMRFAADLFWFNEIGYQRVFATELLTKVLLFLIVGGVTYALLTVNLRIARRGETVVNVFTGQVPENLMEVLERLPRLTTPVALVFSGSRRDFGDGRVDDRTAIPERYAIWRDRSGLQSRHRFLHVHGAGVVAGARLPEHRDGAVRGAGGICVPRSRRHPPAEPEACSCHLARRRHLGILVIVFLVLAALRIWFVQIPELLYSNTGPFTGASYTDLNARRPGLHLAAIVALLGAAWVAAAVVRRRVLPAAPIALIAYVAVGFLGRAVYPSIIQRLVVAPTELTRERPYLANHIKATRIAWGIDSVVTRDVTGDIALTLQDIRANGPTIENVRLWDREPLLQTFGQLQEIRTYYDFVNVDDDRYMIEGRYRQVLLSARELNTASIPARTFINDHLSYTHGMGVTLAPVNQVTTEGLPVLFVKDLPPASTVALNVSRPQIYFGELTNDYAIVGTNQPEFDHPSGDSTVYAAYQGRGGVPLTFMRRAILAWHFGSMRMLLSGDLSAQSRILYNRNIVDARGARVAVPAARRRPVPRAHGRRCAGLDHRRVHNHVAVSVCSALWQTARRTCGTA